MASEYDVVGAFQDIEMELIKSMRRNMKRHIGEEFQEGINWTQWQAEMLNGLAKYKEENADKLPKYFSTINQDIEDAIIEAYKTGESEQEIEILEAIRDGYKADKTGKGTNAMQGSFFKVNEGKLNALIKSTTDDMQKAESAVLRMANDVYRQTIFKAQMYYNTGAGSLWKAVDMATKDFLSRGINSVEYKNGARVNVASYSEMALRTANKRANLMGCANKRMEYGIHTVKVSTHNSACPLCVKWQGKVYYDDVYGAVMVQEKKGIAGFKKYPLLSEAVKGGMFHPNCKNGLSTYYEGISQPPKEPTKEEKEEMVRRYNLQQEQRACERNIRKYKRLEAGSLDSDNVAYYADKKQQWIGKYNKLIAENPDVLRADPARLKLYGITATDIKPAVKATAKAGSIRNYSGELAKGLGKAHYDNIHDIVDKCGNANLTKLWDKVEDELKVGNAHKSGGAYAMGKSLYLDIDKCAKGNKWDKPYQVLFHEAGHGIDSACRKYASGSGVFASHFSGAYKGGLFPQTIKEEVDDLVKVIDKKLKQAFKDHAGDVEWFYNQGHISASTYDMYKRGIYKADSIIPKYRKAHAYSALQKEIKAYKNPYAIADLSDMLEGATGAKVQCGYGHGAKYWKDRTVGGIADGLATEAFAEMTDSTFTNPESLELIKKYLPKSYKVYEEMLEVLVNG